MRLIDENVRRVAEEDLEWADVAMLTWMDHERDRVNELLDRARAAGAVTVLGGPGSRRSRSGAPGADFLRVGELGDATGRLVARLKKSVEPASAQEILRTEQRLPMEFPMPAYELIRPLRLHDRQRPVVQRLAYRCEFCDIPEL